MPTQIKTDTAFKRLAVGSRFTHLGSSYRKANGRGATKLLPSGRGQTNVVVPFARSTTVTVDHDRNGDR